MVNMILNEQGDQHIRIEENGHWSCDSLSTWAGLSAGAFGFGGWEQALRTATEVMAAPSRSDASRSVPPLLVLDEFPYLAQETPRLPSIVQSLYDGLGPGAGASTASFRLLLCGSAISVMADLLSGTRALRGRAALELRVRSFGYRDAREYWGIEDPAAAFAHNALVGGTPGYRELVPDPRVPEDPAQLGGWLTRNVLRPSMPLFDEARRVVHEDPRIRDSAAYSSVLAAVAAGESSPTKIGGLLGRPGYLTDAPADHAGLGRVRDRRHDLLLDRRPVVTVADPMVRFHQLVIEPYLADLEAGRACQVWAEAEHTVESKILGPHFEALAAEWVARYASGEAGLAVGPVGQTVIERKNLNRAGENGPIGVSAKAPAQHQRRREHRPCEATPPTTSCTWLCHDSLATPGPVRSM